MNPNKSLGKTVRKVKRIPTATFPPSKKVNLQTNPSILIGTAETTISFKNAKLSVQPSAIMVEMDTSSPEEMENVPLDTLIECYKHIKENAHSETLKQNAAILKVHNFDEHSFCTNCKKHRGDIWLNTRNPKVCPGKES